MARRPPEGRAATSRRAARSVAGSARSLRSRVLEHLRSRGERGATDDEVERALGLSHQTASARRWELGEQGLVVDSGARRATRSGREAVVWVAREHRRAAARTGGGGTAASRGSNPGAGGSTPPASTTPPRRGALVTWGVGGLESTGRGPLYPSGRRPERGLPPPLRSDPPDQPARFCCVYCAERAGSVIARVWFELWYRLPDPSSPGSTPAACSLPECIQAHREHLRGRAAEGEDTEGAEVAR